MANRPFSVRCAIPGALVTLAGSPIALGAPPFPAQFDLSTLLPANGGTGADGFVIDGAHAYDTSGFAVSSAGDVNGDGVDDVVIGARTAAPGGVSLAGATYVVFGSQGVGAGGELDLLTLNGTNGFVINGIDTFNTSGWSVSGAGDVNGDDIDDLIIGAPNAKPNNQNYAGESYVVFGSHTVGAGGSLDLSSLNGANGFVIKGVDIADISGRSVHSAGDVNNDGIDDVIIGAYGADPGGRSLAGESYVVFGGPNVGASGSLNLSSLNGSNGFVINGIDGYDSSGSAVASAGDVNGDGIDDVIIGAPSASPNNHAASGESYVVFGGSTVGASGSLNLSALNGANGFVVNGIDPSDRSGRAVSAAGDLNGDGIDDFIIGADYAAPNAMTNAGESYVVFGSQTIGAGGAINLSALNGANGFVITGVNAFDYSGRSISEAGDVNGDGFDDVIVSAASADPHAENQSGKSCVVFGSAAVGAGGVLSLSALNGANGFTCNGLDAYDYSGRSVSGAGDLNGDGVDDLIIGAAYGDPDDRINAGECYVVFGRAPVPSCPGDVNHDGKTNVADFNILAGNFATAVTPFTNGDLTGNGFVNVADFNILAGDFACGA